MLPFSVKAYHISNCTMASILDLTNRNSHCCEEIGKGADHKWMTPKKQKHITGNFCLATVCMAMYGGIKSKTTMKACLKLSWKSRSKTGWKWHFGIPRWPPSVLRNSQISFQAPSRERNGQASITIEGSELMNRLAILSPWKWQIMRPRWMEHVFPFRSRCKALSSQCLYSSPYLTEMTWMSACFVQYSDFFKALLHFCISSVIPELFPSLCFSHLYHYFHCAVLETPQQHLDNCIS